MSLISFFTVRGRRSEIRLAGAVLLVVVAALAGMPRHTAAAGATWQYLGPPINYDPTAYNNSNYGTHAVAIDPQDPNTVYVGTTYQGLWKTTDGGQSWFKVNTGSGGSLLDSGRLWTIAIDPQNPNTLYTTAGYGDGGVLKSTDGGVSWTDVFMNTPAEQQVGTDGISWITIDPSNHLHLLASSNQWWNGSSNTGLLESLDGGATWRVISPTGAWGYSQTPFFVTSTTWLLSTQTSGIWRTTDSGQTWTQVSTVSGAHEMRNCFINDGHGRIYVVLAQYALVSTDQGATWTDVSSGLSGGLHGALGFDGTTLYTQAWTYGGDGAVYSMPDGGTSWTQQSPNLCANGSCIGLYDADSRPGLVYFTEFNAGVWKLVTRRTGHLGVSPHHQLPHGSAHRPPLQSPAQYRTPHPPRPATPTT